MRCYCVLIVPPADSCTPLEGEDMEGWETVHRGGRTKSRSNSMKLLTPASQSSSPSNKDATEDPHTQVAALCHSSEKAQSPVSSSSMRIRSRAGSLDSEKENQPRTEYESNQLNICKLCVSLTLTINS